MRVSSATLLLALVGSAQAFTTAPTFGVTKAGQPLFMAEGSSVTVQTVRKSIDSLTADNFSQTLSTIEPFLLNDAGASTYAKSMRRIATKAKATKQAIPDGFAKAAKATLKKREKQDAFIKVKEEEKVAAAEEAAAEATAAAEAAATAAAEAEAAAAAAPEEASPEEPAAPPVEA